MRIDEAIEIVRREWDSQGHCASCGWHAALHEYGDLESAIEINDEKRRLELICLQDSTHRGVRIYYQAPPSQQQEGGS